MSSYLSKKDQDLNKKFLKEGYIIQKVSSLDSLKYLRSEIIKRLCKILNLNMINENEFENFLNKVHKKIKNKNLNMLRLDILNSINNDIKFHENYYEVSKNLLFSLVGNELAMQNRINLSIQLPNDNSSLLPVHSDVWSGDSPFEVVAWIPLVNCYSSKTMYILKPKNYKKIHNNFSIYAGKNSSDFFKSIKNDVEWIKINFGEILIFNQALPHGNIVNSEKETRWSLNCRFKSLYSPYGDKKIGEFFKPITLRAASKIGMNYALPIIKK
ncbi:2OG-Fe(II) oxygenase [Candidatus Pelagibacter ubique]|nr:2OG-Fe(II) oxygenase [Candidatus Pelagibacter ubique]